MTILCVYSSLIEKSKKQKIESLHKTLIMKTKPILTSEKSQIFDITGKLVQEFEMDNIVYNADISKLQNGVYTIRFNFNGELITKRFIVQK